MGNELNIDAQLQADWLDARLRDEAPYIDDAGFTARVVQQLPTRRRTSRSLRAAILITAAIVASIISFVVASPSVLESLAFVAALPPGLVLTLILAVTMLVMIGGTAAAVAKARESRL